MNKKEVYEMIQNFLSQQREEEIPLIKEGLLISEDDKDYIIKVTEKRN